MSDQQRAISPKIAFLFGIVTAVAVVSLAGFVFLLSKSNQAGGDRGGVDDTNNGSGGGVSPQVDVSKTIFDLGKEVGLNADAFESCAVSGKYRDKVNSDAVDAQESGGNGTPFTVVIGPNGASMTVSGALPFDFFKTIADTLLAVGNPMEKVSPEFQPYVSEAKNLAYKPVDKDDHIRGSVDAKVKFIEYSDFECPFCKRHHPVMQKIVSAYSGNDVAWVYRHLPLVSIHPKAQPLAEASECAAELGGNDGFWAFADAVFAQ